MSVAGRSRLLQWDGCLNARDIGGYATRDGRETRWGSVVRSDHPGRLSEVGRQSLVSYGVRTIVDLRMPEELERHPHPFATPAGHDLLYAHRSFIMPDKMSLTELDNMLLLDGYLVMIDSFREAIVSVMKTIATAPEGGVLVHCAIGKDRTGITCGMLLDIAGVDHETIGQDYSLSERNLAPERLAWLENGPGELAWRAQYLIDHNPKPEVMMAVLEHLDQRYGGTVDYLQAGGLSDREISDIYGRLVD